jgi:NADH dehydrogenase (ubiquinone) Fe-S protein 1
MISLTINDVTYEVPKGYTILQACENVGVMVPRFCYHERLSIAGNCRMCLVEVAKSPKLVVSCAMPASEGAQIWTDSPAVRKGREGVLEFLLINHPLDCPICDQGGECDLQDQAMVFGSDRSRFQELKRSVEDKNIGPLIKTIMTRCIHCTRCIRFSSEIAGVADLGTTGRGNAMEIGTYVQKLFHSELSGNVIDLCPVGALTSKPYAFTARPWELKSYESVDISDAVGSNIRIDARGMEILRIIPRSNSSLNFDWISDKARFQYDGFSNQRLISPMVSLMLKTPGTQELLNSGFEQISWKKGINTIDTFTRLTYLKSLINKDGKKEKLGGFQLGRKQIGKLADLHSIVAFDHMLWRLGYNFKAKRNIDFSSSYTFGTTFKEIENCDTCLLIGTDPLKEATLVNVHLRERFLQGSFSVMNIGAPLKVTYPVTNLGNSTRTLLDLAEGKHWFCETLLESSKPLVIIGQNTYEREDYQTISLIFQKIKQYVPLLEVNVLHHNASRVAELDVGCFNDNFEDSKDNPSGVSIHWGEREIPRSSNELIDGSSCSGSLHVFIGHNGIPSEMKTSDVILPSTNSTEKVGTYVNTEGRAQKTSVVNTPAGKIRQDWSIFGALDDMLKDLRNVASFSSNSKGRVDTSIVYTQDELDERIIQLAPQAHSSWQDNRRNFGSLKGLTEVCLSAVNKNSKGILDVSILDTFIQDFYRTDQISSSSSTMAKCSQQFVRKYNSFTSK